MCTNLVKLGTDMSRHLTNYQKKLWRNGNHNPEFCVLVIVRIANPWPYPTNVNFRKNSVFWPEFYFCCWGKVLASKLKFYKKSLVVFGLRCTLYILFLEYITIFSLAGDFAIDLFLILSDWLKTESVFCSVWSRESNQEQQNAKRERYHYATSSHSTRNIDKALWN